MNAFDYARQREKELADGLRQLAAKHNVTLREPLQIDSRGDFSIVASNGTNRDTLTDATGRFGTLAEVLNKYQPRTGIYPGAILIPENGWCYMNHFQVEKMIAENR